MKPIIEADEISKLYQLGTIGATTMRESFERWWCRVRRKQPHYQALKQKRVMVEPNDPQAGPAPNTIWALKDATFEVSRGEVIGIIGRNGAGKSTLLKILSRITEPTSGRVILRGRISSLLEVGTGFHPELTGRENIYLNGAILGMRKAEINRKFDEIVSFAEIEKFIDTPVKHYSSGMYVRLAFAIAAHLESEILLIDEVLAVGDAAFQKKCLGKMGNVAKQGRTVLFVSHNMQAVQMLCERALYLGLAKILKFGDCKTTVSEYLSKLSPMASEIVWDKKGQPGNDEIRLVALRVMDQDKSSLGIFSSKRSIYVEMEFLAYKNPHGLGIGFDLVRSDGVVVARSYHNDLAPENWLQVNIGLNKWVCVIPSGFLNAGVYQICPRIGIHNATWIVNLDGVVQFEVVLDHGVSPFWNSLDARNRPGVIAPLFEWKKQ